MSDQIYPLLKEAAFRAFRQSRKRHEGAEFYVVGLFTSGEYAYLVDTTATIEALREVAAQYLGRPVGFCEPDALDSQMRELKWSLPDSPYHGEFGQAFNDVNDLLGELLTEADVDKPDAYWARDKAVNDACYQVLEEIRDSGLFDKDKVVFALFMGDQSNEERLINIERLNPHHLIEAFRNEVSIDEGEADLMRADYWKFEDDGSG